MKSLFKVIRRYVLTAALITVMVLLFNLGILFWWGGSIAKGRQNIPVRQQMRELSMELKNNGGSYEMSQDGSRKLAESDFAWGMLVENDGQVSWSYQLPPEIPHKYTMADMSILSKWYLKDYPVFTWVYGDGVLVMARAKDSVARFNMEYSIQAIKQMPELFLSMVLLNLFLIFLLALLFGYRFYRSLRPIAQGIEQLSNKGTVSLPEKGITDELSRRLNQTSRILEQQNFQLASRDNARTNWIAGVSHDIRTPLSLILGYADSLSQNPALDEKGKEKADAISRQGIQIKKLIEDLNLTSKLEYGVQPLRVEKFLLASFLRQVAADFYNEGMLGDSKLDLDMNMAVEHLAIQGDKQLLSRAIQNLIANSVRYAPGGEIEVCMFRKGGWVQLLFRDSGQGISEEVAAIVEGKSENQNIHVMGLRVVWQIVQAHKGRMEFILKGEKRYEVGLFLPILL